MNAINIFSIIVNLFSFTTVINKQTIQQLKNGNGVKLC